MTVESAKLGDDLMIPVSFNVLISSGISETLASLGNTYVT